jgi:hypothetical protein
MKDFLYAKIAIFECLYKEIMIINNNNKYVKSTVMILGTFFI